MDTVAFIPVRGGSQSIPKKNIAPLAGRPLVHWVMDAALGCRGIDRVFVASDCAEIRAVAGEIKNPKLFVIDRDPATATNEATTESALLDFSSKYDFDRVVLIQATSPLLVSDDLEGAFAQLDASGADSMLSVTREHRFIWKRDPQGGVRPSNYRPSNRPRRQDWEGELFENGAFYITSKKSLEASRCRLSGVIEAFPMCPESAVELDEPADWGLVEKLLRDRKQRGDLLERCRRIRLLVTDVDGVLTDSGMYYSAEGEQEKKFSTRDGMGLAVWRNAGFETVIMTGENSPIVTSRAAKLKIDDVYLGIQDKRKTLDEVIQKKNLGPEEVAFIGDDINDLPALRVVGVSACPRNAEPSVLDVAHYICERNGGEGCVREFIDLILRLKRG